MVFIGCGEVEKKRGGRVKSQAETTDGERAKGEERKYLRVIYYYHLPLFL